MTSGNDMRDHEAFLEDAAAYALGVLAADEAASFVAHMKHCLQCRREYAILSASVSALAAGGDPIVGSTPSPLLKIRVMQQVEAERIKKPRSFVSLAYWAAAACLLIALAVSFSDLALRSHLAQERARGSEQNRTIADLLARSVQRYPFEQGAVLTREGRVYIAMHDLPALPPGRVYQAWTLNKGAKTPVASLTFLPSGEGTALIELPVRAPALAGVAVSVEPSGGSLSPTTKPIAFVKLGA